MSLPSKPRKYLYLQITPQNAVEKNTTKKVSQFDKPMPLNLTQRVDQMLYDLQTCGERLSLVNGDIAYRVLKQYSWRLKVDRLGYYLDVYPFGRKRFVETDPCLSIKPVKTTMDWVPIV
jgi:hypothetical protein